MKRPSLVALVCLAPLAALTAVLGPLPDSDRAAHTLWARELLREGSLVISPDGVVNDWGAYYPNTVPKPGDLLLSIAGALTGGTAESLIWLGLGWAVLLFAARAAGQRGRVLTGVFLGLNPVFLNLCLARSPAIPFMALIFLGSAADSPVALAFSSLVRPEGFIYAGWRIRGKWKTPALALLLVSGAAWVWLNAGACGDLFWSGREVRYCVAAMGYGTPGVVTYPPWLLLRAVAVLGPLPLSVLMARIGEWDLRHPVGLNLLLLWAGLAFGSLVLPRYADQIILLAVPFAMNSVMKAFPRRPAMIAALCLAGAVTPWWETAGSIRTEMRLNTGLEAIAPMLPDGMVAANELVVPRLALLGDGADYPGRFVALDRAVWEGADEDSLLARGVTSIVIFHRDFYLSEHGREWLGTLSGRIPVFDVSAMGAR